MSIEPMSQYAIREDPPASHRGSPGNGSVQQFVAACVAQPWEWFKYAVSYKNGSATYSFSRRFPNTEWVSASNGQGRVHLFCRYVGVPDTRPAPTPDLPRIAPPPRFVPRDAADAAWLDAAVWNPDKKNWYAPDGSPRPPAAV